MNVSGDIYMYIELVLCNLKTPIFNQSSLYLWKVFSSLYIYFLLLVYLFKYMKMFVNA